MVPLNNRVVSALGLTAAFARMGLPILEIYLRAFTPESFSPKAVKVAVLDDVATNLLLPSHQTGATGKNRTCD